MSEETPKKEKTIGERLEDWHPKFLDAIKEVYPLAVLGSLSVAIAAFTSQSYPDTQAFAIAAASLFLLAFALSFLFKIVKGYQIALLSYVSTSLAIVFLFAVVVTFYQEIPLVSRSVEVLGTSIIVFGLSGIALFYYSQRKKGKSVFARFCTIVGFPSVLFVIGFYIVQALGKFMDFSIPPLLVTLNAFVLVLSILPFFVYFIAKVIGKKDKKNE